MVAADGSREPHQHADASIDVAPPPPPRPDVPFDVQAVIRRAHFSFRQEDGRFTGGHSSYAVAVDARTFRVSPIHAATLPEPPRDPRSSLAHRPEPPEKAEVGTPLVLATTSIGRGGMTFRTPEAASVDAEGRLLRRGSAVEEILENKPDGAELSWTFPAKPAGEGDIEVRVAASGLDYAGVTAGGLHFRERASSLGIRFGHATWIDASGTRTDVAARWDGGEIVMTVPASAVESGSYPAMLDPILGPETTLDSPVTGPASGGQQSPSAAYDPATGVYFVAWSDTRSMTNFQVFGTRISPGGAVLDPDGIMLNAPGVYSYGPSVVFDGTNFLVVFSATVGNGARWLAG